jgi:plasmid stabilization system protein ParE
MMYTVIWKPVAEDELAHIWNTADDRTGVSAAANEIDQLLRSDPHEQGESRSGAIRVLLVAPLGVFFHVADDDRLVSILRVWSIT